MEENVRNHPVRSAFGKLFKNKLATVCFFLLIIEIVLVILAPVIAPYGYDEADPSIKLRPGFWAQWTVSDDPESPRYSNNPKDFYEPGHLLGTDDLGRDVLSRLLYGGRVSLTVGFVSTLMGLSIGVVCGLLAAYYKRLDNIIMRVMDLLFAFPSILLAMLVIAMLGVNTFNTMLAISIWSVPSFARMVRGRALQVKEEDYIMATRSLGAKDSRILLHILKNCLPVIIVIATMRMATSIISISTLSYLGMGVTPPQPEWGGMIASAKSFMWERPSLIFVPGAAVMLTVICFNVLGDKLRDILDPSLKD
ncbi:MAG: ABC transporter permease [Clostridiales bacterium]|nr:ABC transporter permease [Clostridiales bacterium]